MDNIFKLSVKKYGDYFYIDFKAEKNMTKNKLNCNNHIISYYCGMAASKYREDAIQHGAKLYHRDYDFLVFLTRYRANKFLNHINKITVFNCLINNGVDEALMRMPVRFYLYSKKIRQKLINFIKEKYIHKVEFITSEEILYSFLNQYKIPVDEGAVRGAMMQLGYNDYIQYKYCVYKLK